ncbi:hypothetical protein ElyMa_004107700 [Elysia marginata]|uniref:Transmembrane protein n=1 Tax=Elysia marginata TaxID=1093978 RepID=A0AAV4GCI3_9GAST|nr:hypothetical protein ElyMa_004107700 [Elysia marginata]
MFKTKYSHCSNHYLYEPKKWKTRNRNSVFVVVVVVVVVVEVVVVVVVVIAVMGRERSCQFGDQRFRNRFGKSAPVN